MSRLLRLGLLAMLLAGSIDVATLVLPGRALACSCRVTGPERIGTFADDPTTLVFVGTVVSVSNQQDGSGHTTGDLLIQTVFKGSVPSAHVPVVGGGGGDCTIGLTAGQRLVTAASFENGVVTPGLCQPLGDPSTAEGQALVSAAIAAYGPGTAPPGVEEPSPALIPDDPWLPVILVALIAGTAALFLLVAIASRRRATG